MRKRLDGLDGKMIRSGLLKASAAGVLMAIALWKWIPLTSNNSIWIQGAVGILIGLLVYIAGLSILRTEELKQVFQAVRTRLG